MFLDATASESADHAYAGKGWEKSKLSESACECLNEPVVVQGDVRDRLSGMPQLIGCSFQQ